jgi:hypothetical protein
MKIVLPEYFEETWKEAIGGRSYCATLRRMEAYLAWDICLYSRIFLRDMEKKLTYV